MRLRDIFDVAVYTVKHYVNSFRCTCGWVWKHRYTTDPDCPVHGDE